MSPNPMDFAQFYAESKDVCLRAVLVGVGDLDTAQDLVDEAFARAWASWRKVRSHPAPQAWVVRVALNAGVSAWRRAPRERPVAGDGMAGLPDTAGVDLGDGIVAGDIMAALKRLPLRQRQVVAFRVFLDMDTANAARALGMAPGTVRAHLARAIATLRHEFAIEERG
ncbi:MAG TPA: sigma-70 family RNA polymerase sigma factor [Streptosporangiaceae bacterium]|nr:sigma-70 family RNA polymerase sigma factor [Streptosporangiaceae bacterium]